MSANNFNISIKESSDQNSHIINVSGELTIENSISIHKFLLKKIKSPDIVTVKVEESDSVDLSFVQLIVGFIKARNKSNKKTHVEFNVNEVVIELLAKSGSTKLISSLQLNN